jgi:hypothetical protein
MKSPIHWRENQVRKSPVVKFISIRFEQSGNIAETDKNVVGFTRELQ